MLNTTQVSQVSHSAIGELPQHCCTLCTLRLPNGLLKIPPSSNLTEPAGDALYSVGCQMTIPIISLYFSCSFNCNVGDKNTSPSPLRPVRNTTTKTRQRFHLVADISLGLVTVLQHLQES